MADPYILLAIQLLDGFLMKKHGGIDEAMQRVRNNLSLILDFVADKKLEEGSSLKYWIDDVKEIARDILLLLIHEKNAMLFPFLSLARALNETKKCIFKLGAEQATKCPIASSSHPEEVDEDVVGLEQEVESLLHTSVLYGGGDLSTTCIVGMAGIGKTTLARKLYNHATVVDRYEPRLWICVSGELSNKEVLMRLLLQLHNNNDQSALLEELENAHNGGLQLMLRQHLQDKQFLIVLDDVANIPYSESILKALPTQGKQSILLLTSRFQSIVYQLPTAQGSTHIMKPLDDDQSWHLFSKLLLFGNQQFPKQLERKGREMLRSCAGLPLSLKEVATQFVIKRQEGSEWEELLESIDLSRTFAVLESCYHAWPPQLKLCFLSLSFFEKGTHIRIDKLIQVWTSSEVIPQEEEEGRDLLEECQFNILSIFINPTGPRRMVSGNLEGYRTTLMKLNDESVIEIDMSYNLRIRCIRVNASFHALSMAKAEEEMIFETLKKGGGGNPPSSKEPRHRAICCSRDEFNHFTDHDERLVSLFYSGGGYFDASELYWKRFQQLRTLDFEGFGVKMLPEAIGALTELRYLGLRDNYIQKLPESVGYLKNLETLDIALNFTVEVPDIVWKIGSLRHLYMSDIICWKPLKIDALKNLETLTYISIDNWTYEASSLEMMNSLCILGIEEVDENVDLSKLFASLANLKKLDYLFLRGFRFRSLPSLHGLETLHHLLEIRLDGIITELPSADIFPPKIAYLSLINSSLDEDPMPELGKLDHLLYLKLKNAYTGEKMVIPKNRFRYLDSLCIEELWHLRNIQVEDSTFSLMKLEIKSCPYLENIPESVITHDATEVEILTTKRLAAKIRKSDFISKIKKVDIQP